jgi:hypothetical protein
LIRAPRSLAVVAVMLGGAASASCIDPVHSDDVAALGGEVSGVREGPTHRPGQPCLVCHGGKGPGSPEFELAGTIYEFRDVPSGGVEGVEVRITDVTGKVVTLQSNRAGNFYREKDRQTLYYPLNVELNDSRITDAPVGVKKMLTPIGRNGACAFCHVNNLNAADKTTHMPHVYLNLAPPK